MRYAIDTLKTRTVLGLLFGQYLFSYSILFWIVEIIASHLGQDFFLSIIVDIYYIYCQREIMIVPFNFHLLFVNWDFVRNGK